MKIKLPSPRDGWRAFAGEVGVIVLGVLIALAAQEAVEEFRWREEVRRTEDALAMEIATSVVHAGERQIVNRCLVERLARLVGKVNSNRGPWSADQMPIEQAMLGVTAVPATYRHPYRTPNRPWSDSLWRAAQNGGVFNHMNRERLAGLAKIYARMDGLRKVNEVEQQVFPELLYLSFDTQLDVKARQHALSTLGKLDWLNSTIAFDSKNLIDEVRTVGLDFSRTGLTRDLAKVERTQRKLRGPCIEHVEVGL